VGHQFESSARGGGRGIRTLGDSRFNGFKGHTRIYVVLAVALGLVTGLSGLVTSCESAPYDQD
jgi:hypothetical protein